MATGVAGRRRASASLAFRGAPVIAAHAAISSASAAKPPTKRALVRERQRRLDQERIAEQADQAAEVARRVEEVGIAAGDPREPALQERRGGRRRRRTAGRRPRQRDQQPCDRGLALGARAAAPTAEGARSDEGSSSTWTTPARGRQAGSVDVRVQIAEQQRALEEDQAGVPDGRRAAEQGQHHPGEHRLDHEEERRRDEHGGGEQGEADACRRGVAGHDCHTPRRRAGASCPRPRRATSSRTSSPRAGRLRPRRCCRPRRRRRLRPPACRWRRARRRPSSSPACRRPSKRSRRRWSGRG